ncbi:MAG: TonB-dependent receptor, partial [Candidatus Eremiobacteraeota bacterium]|nr:TonB-dependent receptor [Candidatus Eremiobacteraeota bacterium]
MNRILAAVCAALFSFIAIPAGAATMGLVRGNVIVNNSPHAGVHVTLKGDQTLFNTQTDAGGNYIFPQVPFGHYTLTASSAGVTDKSLGIDVSSDDVMTVNLALGDLKIIASANVTSHAGITGTPVSGNILSRSQLGALPVNNSLDRILETVPGIVRFSYDEPVAHGFHGVTYEVDGAPIPQATSSNFSEIIDPKNVDSIEIFTGAFPAEYGGSRQGAVINIVTNRANDLKGPEGNFTIGGGNYGQAMTSLNQGLKFGKTDLFFSANSQHSDRGLDAPTFTQLQDNASQSDQFLRIVTPVGDRDTLAF